MLMLDVITHPWLNLNGSLYKLPLKAWQAGLIDSQFFIEM